MSSLLPPAREPILTPCSPPDRMRMSSLKTQRNPFGRSTRTSWRQSSPPRALTSLGAHSPFSKGSGRASPGLSAKRRCGIPRQAWMEIRSRESDVRVSPLPKDSSVPLLIVCTHGCAKMLRASRKSTRGSSGTSRTACRRWKADGAWTGRRQKCVSLSVYPAPWARS